MQKKLLTILISTIAISAMSQNILTIGEVFDFNVDDEFHIANVAYFPAAQRITVIEKEYSKNEDTLYYKLFNDSYTSQWDDNLNQLEYTFKTKTEEVYYTNLDSSIFTFDWLADFPQDTTEYYSYDSLIYIDTSLCDTQINGHKRVVGNFEPSTTHIEYGQGLGRTYRMDSGPPVGNPDWEYKLVYYNKAGYECGIPDRITNSNEKNISGKPDFLVFPTLINNRISIKASDQGSIYDVRIIDLSGKILAEIENMIGDHSINTEKIASGIYVLVINYGKHIYTARIIKK